MRLPVSRAFDSWQTPKAGDLAEGTSTVREQDKGRTIREAQEELLTPSEVAELFRVDPKTATRWAVAGRLGSIRTPGGHRRFRQSEVHQLLAESTQHANKHKDSA